MEYTSDGISRIRFGNTDYSIKDEPLRNSFVRLSNIIKENNREIQEYMESNSMDTAYMTYNLNNATSFLYAFSEVCVNQISKLNTYFSDVSYSTYLLENRVSYLEQTHVPSREYNDLYTYTHNNIESINSRTSYATTTREGVVQLCGSDYIIDEMYYRNDARAVTPSGLATALSYCVGNEVDSKLYSKLYVCSATDYDEITPETGVFYYIYDV